MLINLRNALMAGKRLPYDAEVEFLESTGTQWIDTEYVPNGNEAIEVAGAMTGTSSTGGLFGSIGTGANIHMGVSASQNAFLSGWGSTQRTAGTFDTGFHVFKTGLKVGLWKDGQFITTFGTNTQAYGRKIALFKKDNGSNALARISHFYIEGIIDLIPVRKGTVGYIYDRVSGKLFGNAGTGDFVLGPDVVPVEYIESHGGEWIDTGVIGNSSTKVEIKAQGTNTSALQTLCGCRDSSGRYSFAVWQRSILDGAYGMRWDYIATNTGGGGGYVLYGVWNTSQPNLVVKDGVNNYLNGVQLGANASNSFSCNFPLALFAMNTGGSRGNFFVGKMFVCKISNNNTPTRDYVPVRVGTEGAMMDTITRRIYRNAGTGAFSYGNDLKYPIPA